MALFREVESRETGREGTTAENMSWQRLDPRIACGLRVSCSMDWLYMSAILFVIESWKEVTSLL